MRSNMITINGDYLRQEAAKRNTTLADMARTIGANGNYLSSAINDGKANRVHIKALVREYGLDEDLLTSVKTKETEITEKTNDAMGEDLQKLYDVIYKAVYSAVKKAWMDE